MGRAGCLAEENSGYSQPVVRAGLGKAASEHPAFLGREHGLHPRLWGKAVSSGWVLLASKMEGILPSSPGLQKSISAHDTGTCCAGPSGEEVVMWEQHPSLQPAQAELRGGDVSKVSPGRLK